MHELRDCFHPLTQGVLLAQRGLGRRLGRWLGPRLGWRLWRRRLRLGRMWLRVGRLRVVWQVSLPCSPPDSSCAAAQSAPTKTLKVATVSRIDQTRVPDAHWPQGLYRHLWTTLCAAATASLSSLISGQHESRMQACAGPSNHDAAIRMPFGAGAALPQDLDRSKPIASIL